MILITSQTCLYGFPVSWKCFVNSPAFLVNSVAIHDLSKNLTLFGTCVCEVFNHHIILLVALLSPFHIA
jgi:hypothetical protein